MCAVCRQRMPKEKLTRIAVLDDEIILDDNRGRGIYICHSEQCIQKGIKNKILNKITKLNIPDEIYEQLK